MDFKRHKCLEFAKSFNALPNDFEKWHWIKTHQHLGITVFLDNDDTFATFDCQVDDEDPVVLQFDEYIGNVGSHNLLTVLGIKHEEV